MPNIARNVRDALDEGHPGVLTYDPSRVRANRRAACGMAWSLTCDEYQFASTREAGRGAGTASVLKKEQDTQGAVMANFYRKYKLRPGIGTGFASRTDT